MQRTEAPVQHKPVSQVYRIEVERKADGRRFIRDFHAGDADKAIADYRAMLDDEADNYSFVSVQPLLPLGEFVSTTPETPPENWGSADSVAKLLNNWPRLAKEWPNDGQDEG